MVCTGGPGTEVLCIPRDITHLGIPQTFGNTPKGSCDNWASAYSWPRGHGGTQGPTLSPGYHQPRPPRAPSLLPGAGTMGWAHSWMCHRHAR